MQLQDDKFI